MTIYHNYKIKDVSEEDGFLSEIKEDLHGLGSCVGFITGDVDTMIDRYKADNLTLETLEEFKEGLEEFTTRYFKISNTVWDEWERRGSKLSMNQQIRLKKELDEKDRIKEEYYDR